MLKTLLAAACVLMSGCAGFVGNTTMASPDALKKASTADLVYGYGYDWKYFGKKNQNIRAELESRAVFAPESWELIDSKKLKQGVSASVVMASWGPPRRKTETVYEGYRAEAWCYEDPDNKATLYFEDAILKGWSQ